jgi:hypothetical protein
MTVYKNDINPQAGIAGNVQAIIDAFRAKKAAMLKGNTASAQKPDNPSDWNKAPPRQIRSFTQGSTDTQTDTLQTSRTLGDLTGGKTRLNLFSALTKNDKVDFYNFNVTTAGKAGMSVSSDVGVHVQVLNKNGQVIADSEAKFGDKKDNYEDMAATRLYLEKGTYYLKVTRATGTVDTVKPNYAIQISMGKYIESDYDTTESPASQVSLAASLGTANSQATANVSSILNSFAGGNLFDFLT